MTKPEIQLLEKAASILIRELCYIRPNFQAQNIQREIEITNALIEMLCAFLQVPMHRVKSSCRERPIVYHRQRIMVAVWKTTMYPHTLIDSCFESRGSKTVSRGKLRFALTKISDEEVSELVQKCKDFIEHLNIKL